MTVKEMIELLKKENPEDTVLIYIRPETTNLDGIDYNLIDPVVNADNGWDNLTTIEPGEIVGM